MTQVYHLWREPNAGTTTLEDASVVAMTPANFEISLAGAMGHLDQQYTIKLGLVDAMDEFREQLDRIPFDSAEPVKIIYREYLSDDLTASMAVATLQAESVSYALGAASVTATAPRYNVARTGIVYAPRDIPMLRGF